MLTRLHTHRIKSLGKLSGSSAVGLRVPLQVAEQAQMAAEGTLTCWDVLGFCERFSSFENLLTIFLGEDEVQFSELGGGRRR